MKQYYWIATETGEFDGPFATAALARKACVEACKNVNDDFGPVVIAEGVERGVVQISREWAARSYFG